MSIPSAPRNLPISASRTEGHFTPVAPRLAARLGQALTNWSRRRADGPETAIDEFADLLAESCRPDMIEKALITLAKRVAGPGASEVRLIRPTDLTPLTSAAPEGSVVEFPLRFEGKDHGTIRIVFEGPHHFSPERHRRLTTLGVLGGSIDCHTLNTPPTADHRKQASTPQITWDMATGLPNTAFLTSFLAYALALTERRREPLSVLYIGVDRLTAIRTLHGHDFADQSLRKVATTIAGTLRTSDLIARLDDGRLVAVLPGASVENSLRVAETVRHAIASTGAPSRSMPLLTASIGVATFPNHAIDSVALRATAAAALADARAQGYDRVVGASARDPEETVILQLADDAG